MQLAGRTDAAQLAVELRGVAFAYSRGQTVLTATDLRVDQGELVAVAGPNGGGKTTLVRLVLGLLEPTEGEAFLYGEPARRFSRRATLGYLAQRSQLGTEAPATVAEVVGAGRLATSGLLGPLRRRDRAIVSEAIERVGLGGLDRRALSTLSGGQQQRTFIAKALAAEPSLLILDEPTAGVDVDAQEALASLLATLHRDLGVTILYVSHEFGAIERYVQRLLLVRGAIVFDGPPGALPERWHDPSHVHV
jgi:zinc transport system ATP-binding protein